MSKKQQASKAGYRVDLDWWRNEQILTETMSTDQSLLLAIAERLERLVEVLGQEPIRMRFYSSSMKDLGADDPEANELLSVPEDACWVGVEHD